MKRSLSFAVEILIKLGACLTACVGCSSKGPPSPEKPRVIRWRAEDSGYRTTTTVQPADNGGSTDMK